MSRPAKIMFSVEVEHSEDPELYRLVSGSSTPLHVEGEEPTEDNEIVEFEIELPARYEVCSRCEGKGTHVNPAIDGNGLTREDFAEDPDFEEAYFEGRYDIACLDCEGARVVPVVDASKIEPKLLKLYEEQCRFEAEDRAQCRYEERMGY